MARRRNVKRPRRSAPRRGYTKRAARKAKNRMFRKRVKNVIQSTVETKVISNGVIKAPYTLQATSGNAALWNSTLILTPSVGTDLNNFVGYNIQNGTADGYRIGNKVRVKKVILAITINATKWSAADNPYPAPQNIRMYFWRKKYNDNQSPTISELCGTAGTYFQSGISQTGMVGRLSDLTQMLNTDQYVYLHHIDVKIGNADYAAAGTNGDASTQYFVNNDYSLNYVKRVNITKYMPKIFSWNDQGIPMTPYTFCTLQTVRADGSLASATDKPLNWVTNLEVSYTDA